MIDEIIGSAFFEFIGASIRWFFAALVSKIKGKKVIGFKEVWQGKKSYKKPDILLHGVFNILLGLLTVVFIFLLLNRIYRYFI